MEHIHSTDTVVEIVSNVVVIKVHRMDTFVRAVSLLGHLKRCLNTTHSAFSTVMGKNACNPSLVLLEIMETGLKKNPIHMKEVEQN